MRMRYFFLLSLVFAFCLGSATRAHGQSSSDPARPVVRKTAPRYPDVARRMNLAGTVKVFAVVAPDGKVKSVQPVGGSPLLIQAAQDAVSQWKYAPAAAESKELVELHFNPE